MSDTRTFEELLIERINKMLVALDTASYEQFDQILDNTEILLKVKKGLHEIYMKWKIFYASTLDATYRTIEEKAAGEDDPYSKKMKKERDESLAEWGYRMDVLQKLLLLLNDYNLVPYSTPEYAEIKPEPEQPPEEIAEEVVQPEQPAQKTEQELLAEQMVRLQAEEAEIVNQQQQQKDKKIRFVPKRK